MDLKQKSGLHCFIRSAAQREACSVRRAATSLPCNPLNKHTLVQEKLTVMYYKMVIQRRKRHTFIGRKSTMAAISTLLFTENIEHYVAPFIGLFGLHAYTNGIFASLLKDSPLHFTHLWPSPLWLFFINLPSFECCQPEW